MKIRKVAFRNFGSYGNKTITLDIPNEPGLFSVQGDNGAGKSTLSDAIKFGIYGKLEDKKLKDMANRLNKNAYIRVELSTRQGEVAIERGIEPGFFKLYIDGHEFDKAGKRSVQEFLEEEILEMPFYVFSNTLSISIDDFKSFLRMSSFDKKAIIDKIFGLTVLNKMRDIIKSQTKKLKDMVKSLDSAIEAYQNTMTQTESEMKLLEEKLQTKTGERLTTLTEAKVSAEKNLATGKGNLQKILTKKVEINESRKNVRESISGDRALASEAQKKINLYQNSKCPMCEGDLDTDFHKEILKQCQDTYQESLTRIQEKDSILVTLNEKLRNVEELETNTRHSIAKIEFRIGEINRELKELEKGDNEDVQTASLQNMFEDLKKKVSDSRENQLKTSTAISYFGLVEEILGEKGVKQMAIRSILPSLNSEIARLVKTMGIEHKIIFNEDFDAEITHFGIPVSASTLSTGEMKKVDFAVLLAVIRLMKIKYPQTNMIFLDELFASIDGNGQTHILNILRDVCNAYMINIFVISHYPLEPAAFDYVINVKKVGGFTTMETSKVR